MNSENQTPEELLRLQFECLKLMFHQMALLQDEIRALRKSTEDLAIAQNAILHKISQDYSDFPAISPN